MAVINVDGKDTFGLVVLTTDGADYTVGVQLGVQDIHIKADATTVSSRTNGLLMVVSIEGSRRVV